MKNFKSYFFSKDFASKLANNATLSKTDVLFFLLLNVLCCS